MDVRLYSVRLFIFTISFALVASCGNRYDLDTEYGRRARIDDANLFISSGDCDRAIEAMLPLYNSNHRDNEVVLITASAYACNGGFKLATVAANLAGTSDYFAALAKSMPNTLNDGKITALYSAVDILTNANVTLDAASRSADINTYMVFLQLGVVGAVLHAYGSPNTSTGAQGAALVYSNPRVGGEMANLDACALAAAMSAISDSFPRSNLSDANSTAAYNSLNAACVTAGLASCADIERDRTACDGTAGGDSLVASNIVTAVNTAWLP